MQGFVKFVHIDGNHIDGIKNVTMEPILSCFLENYEILILPN